MAGIYRELCLESVKNKYECEIQASRQHCEVVPAILYQSFSFTVCHAFQVQCIFLCFNFLCSNFSIAVTCYFNVILL